MMGACDSFVVAFVSPGHVSEPTVPHQRQGEHHEVSTGMVISMGTAIFKNAASTEELKASSCRKVINTIRVRKARQHWK